MLRYEFEAGLGELEREFERKLKEEKVDAWFERLKNGSAEDWRKAVMKILYDEKQRTFPRFSEVQRAMSIVLGERREKEFIERSEERRRRDVDLWTDDVFEVNRNRVIEIMSAIDTKTCDQLARKFSQESFVPGLTIAKDGCNHENCFDGIVPVTIDEGKDFRRYSGWCIHCRREEKPFGAPWVDPETLQVC